MLFLHNTSRVDDEPYPRLLQEKGFRGFPSLCFMDADGNVLTAKMSRTVASFEQVGQQLKAYQDLKAKAAKGGGADVQKKLFLAELELGLLDEAAIAARADKLTLSKAEQELVDRHRFDAEYRDLQGRMRELGRDKYGEELLKLARSGRKPTDGNAVGFYGNVATAAIQAKDLELAEQAYAALEKLDGVNPVALKRLRQQIDQAKGN